METYNKNLIPVQYVSVWDGDEITTQANYDPHTKIVSDIEVTDIGEDYNTCEREFIRLDNGDEFDVEYDEDNDLHIAQTDSGTMDEPACQDDEFKCEDDPQTKSEHTPGPWLSSQHEDNRDVVIINHKGIIIANCTVDGRDQISESEQIANANLIAAAPDLLESLKEMCAFFREISEDESLIEEKDEVMYAKAQALLERLEPKDKTPKF